MIKYSFDFDGTLTEKRQQEIAKRLIQLKQEVWITTNHSSKDDNTELFDIAEKIGISKNRIQLAGKHNKSDLLNGFDFHFDNDIDDINDIEKETNCKCIYVNNIIL